MSEFINDYIDSARYENHVQDWYEEDYRDVYGDNFKRWLRRESVGKMKMDKVAGSGNDEFYTPIYAITPILKYLKPCSTIWCPFDMQDSNYVKELTKEGHRVLYSHIDMDIDFFSCEVPSCDYIISNPPYSKKKEVFEKLFELNIPFAMLVGVVGLFESKNRFNLFKNNNFEIMYFDKRISYFKNYTDQKPSLNPPFSSVYLCHNMLPTQIVFEEIVK